MLTFACAAVISALATVQAPAEPALLPRPSSVVLPADGKPFALRDPVSISVPRGSRRLAEIAELLASAIRSRTGFTVRTGSVKSTAPAIHLDTALGSANPEAYSLTVTSRGITISGASSAGVLWGMQTLRQLLPPAFESADSGRRPNWKIAGVIVNDAPRFPWRGSMVDASRHFLPVTVIERHIDVLSRYKMNVFHWHLTDDQGWRVEIKRYPKLTQVGAWRTEADGTRYGGFYTQDDIRRVVEYARRRGVTVVPEIEMPGHSLAAIAAYPELGCTGEQLAVGTQWGVSPDVLCVGNDSTLAFMQNVLDEVMLLFPSPYVHIGGDEVPKDRWRACATCQQVMRSEHLANEDELQRWFIGRIGQYLESRGKRLVGWNEILQGGHLLPSAIVQSWQDSSWTRRAVVEGHDVIASPEQWTYLSNSARDLTLERVYAFEPVPPGLDSAALSRIRGGEVALWGEGIATGINLELMSYPRLLAFAEAMWSSSPRDLVSLQARLESDHVARLGAMGIAVGPASRDLMRFGFAYDSATRSAMVRITDAAKGVALHMGERGGAPAFDSPVVPDSTALTGEGARRLQPYYGRERLAEERSVTVVRHRAIGARVTLQSPANRQYRGTGRFNLVDGLLGSTDHADGLWQGWWGPDFDAVVTLDSLQPVKAIGVNFLQDVRSWIILPREVQVSWSSDSADWSAPVTVRHTVPVSAEGARIQAFAVDLPAGIRARFVRVIGRNSGVLPAGHPGAGSPSWLFVDEIVVR